MLLLTQMQKYTTRIILEIRILSGDIMKVRTGYEAVFPDGQAIFVDSQDKDDVYYLFHVYICDPNVRIYVCWNDNSKKEIALI